MKKTVCYLLVSLSLGIAFACSNVLVAGNGNSAVARSMDFDIDTGNTFGFGPKGAKNQANLNLNQGQNLPQATWQTQYNYMGQTWRASHELIDGINDQGLYCGALYLPTFTQYPTYNATDSRPALGTFSLCNYVLATAASTAQAVSALQKVQLIESAATVDPKHLPGIYAVAPLHYIIRDRQGHSAVIEFVQGKTMIYPHAGPVLTNAPTYDWQLKNAERYDYVSPKTINLKMNGSYMSGSGYTGLPGDWMSPSRFVRGTQLLKNMPAPNSETAALSFAWTTLHSMEVPIAASSSMSLWETLSDLKNGRYCLKTMHRLTLDDQHPVISDDPTSPWQCYTFSQMGPDKPLPRGFVSATLNGATMPLKKLLNLMKPSPGPKTKQASLREQLDALMQEKKN